MATLQIPMAKNFADVFNKGEKKSLKPPSTFKKHVVPGA